MGELMKVGAWVLGSGPLFSVGVWRVDGGEG